ncbi:HAMP domain-containing sensor histidine kinase [Lachnospiraceae bacterium KK002]
MKSKKNFNPFFRMVLLLSMTLLAGIVTAIGLFYYMFSIPEPEGMSLAHWPQTFTDNFSSWTTYEDGELSIEQIGLDRLDEYGLWIQFLDESGQEIFSYNKPAGYPEKYSASELLVLGSSDYQNGYTVFVNSLEDSEEACSYCIGFPYDIGKYMLHYNGSRVSRLSPVARIIILAASGTLIIIVLVYGFWLSRKLSGITRGIKNISLRSYRPLQENGMFGEIYSALNKMDRDIHRADQISQETETTRREWIANITHDLKTPLSPIKGYAELLADSSDKEKETVQEYGAVILKNINYTENLINDLKLTWQLDSGAIPYHPQKILITRCVKEWVIDIVNDPAFSDRDIAFESNVPALYAHIDSALFRRAVTNLILNALTHNPAETTVSVTLDTDKNGSILLSVRDNGNGLSEAEQSKLFERYYRGTNTKEKPEGSGLGLAIANQIVTLHGGEITVKSQPGTGTEFIIHVPCKNGEAAN